MSTHRRGAECPPASKSMSDRGKPNMSKDELEGRIRAIEAILLELPEVTPDVIEAARTRIRDPKCHPHPDVAEGMLKMSGHLDQYAEKALVKLKDRAEKTREEHVRRPAV